MMFWLGVLSCAVIQPGDVGVKRRLGNLGNKVYQPGPVGVNPILTKMVRVPVRTVNLEVRLSLPSQEGLNVEAEVSILYRVLPDRVREVLMEIGPTYERSVILATFRSASADVSAGYLAKDMHTAKRYEIEQAIRDRMMTVVSERGFDIEAVLLKSIRLPAGLSEAIEAKLSAEQDAQRMQFVLERERLEAERKRIEAEGVRDAQATVASTIDEAMLRWSAIQAFEALATSPNTKVVITDGNSPLMVDAKN
ncbi:MAG: prohibitin family protein [Myxococcota bacterium]